MGIGTYRHLVTLEHPAVELDPPTWACSLQPAAQVAEGLAAFFVRGRFHPGIGLETQFVFEGRTFQVQAVNDLDERHREIQVTAVEVVGRGTTPSGVPSNVPPTIVEGPEGATIDAGESVILTVIAAGAAPLAYQWTADGVDLPGEIYQFLETGPLTVTTAYAVRVSNAYGSVLSAPAVVTVIAAPITYQEQIIADGASGYWPLDDPSGTTARDLMGAADGTISGGVTLNQPGVTADSKCMTFSSGIVLMSAFVVPQVVTIEAWVKPVNTAAFASVFSNRVAASSFPVLFGLFHTNPTCYADGEAPVTVYSGVNLSVTDWAHVVYIHTASTCAFYVNGEEIVTQGQTRGGASSSSVVAIGADTNSTNAFAGALQDVAVYPRALSPAEILAHYALRVP